MSGDRKSKSPRSAKPLQQKKPYAFAKVPAEFVARPPIWHDGAQSSRLRSGELRCELRTLTPLLVGWERTLFKNRSEEAKKELADLGQLGDEKPVLYPLRAPGGARPVLIPGDSLKGLLRHELGALLGAPMERVQERLYSYRPNLAYPDEDKGRIIEPRLAEVLESKVIDVGEAKYWVPTRVQLWGLAERGDQTYLPRQVRGSWLPIAPETPWYKGGMGAGKPLPKEIYPTDEQSNAPPTIRERVKLKDKVLPDGDPITIGADLHEQYKKTLQHYFNGEDGHFSKRHPRVEDPSKVIEVVKQGAATRAFEEEDMIWVELDTTTPRKILSFGWHYYYRWAYQDTVRTRGIDSAPRRELQATDEEKRSDDSGDHERPAALTAARRLFGYTGDTPGSEGIGKGHYSQLMGRISINAALEVVRGDGKDRFLPPTFLKELGQPKPSAVEHYLQQPHANGHRPGDDAMLVTYGDVAGRDTSGELAGRKFYLDRGDATSSKAWEDDKEDRRSNKRSTLALEASTPDTVFRFTVRFRDLQDDELAALMLALAPQQFAANVGGKHQDGYCSKLGYARPLGWGSVRISVKELQLLERKAGEDGRTKAAFVQQGVTAWFEANNPAGGPEGNQEPFREQLRSWLDLHRCKHPEAGDYPRARAEADEEQRASRPKRSGSGMAAKAADSAEVFTYHTQLRAQHARQRRYRKPGR